MVERMLLGLLLLLLLAVLLRLLRGKRYDYSWTARFIASLEILQSPDTS